MATGHGQHAIVATKVLLYLDARFHAIHDGHVDVQHDGLVEGGWLRSHSVDSFKSILSCVYLVEVWTEALLKSLKKEIVIIGQ